MGRCLSEYSTVGKTLAFRVYIFGDAVARAWYMACVALFRYVPSLASSVLPVYAASYTVPRYGSTTPGQGGMCVGSHLLLCMVRANGVVILAGSWKNRILSALISTRNRAQNADIMCALAWRSSGDCAGTTRSSAYPRFWVR